MRSIGASRVPSTEQNWIGSVVVLVAQGSAATVSIPFAVLYAKARVFVFPSTCLLDQCMSEALTLLKRFTSQLSRCLNNVVQLREV